jgi:hypothetical protein
MSGKRAKANRRADALRLQDPDEQLGMGSAANAYRAGKRAALELRDKQFEYFSREPARVTEGESSEDGYRLTGADSLPDSWPELFMRAISLLRTSLDYLAFELTKANAPETDERSISFPITQKPWNADMRRKILGTSVAVQEAIAQMQPALLDEEDRTRHPLAILDDLRQIHTHRMPAVIAASSGPKGYILHPITMKGNVIIDRGRPLFDGDTPFATPCIVSRDPIRGSDHGGPERAYPTWEQTYFDIMIGPGSGKYEYTPVMYLLGGLFDQVRDIVLIPLVKHLPGSLA